MLIEKKKYHSISNFNVNLGINIIAGDQQETGTMKISPIIVIPSFTAKFSHTPPAESQK